jgi:hypothetical protein
VENNQVAFPLRDFKKMMKLIMIVAVALIIGLYTVGYMQFEKMQDLRIELALAYADYNQLERNYDNQGNEIESLSLRLIEKPKVYNKLRNFGSYQVLRDWLDDVREDLNDASRAYWNCQDYAWWLFERALADSYLMAKYSIGPDTYNEAFDANITGAHAINATYINRHTYLIEPQGLIIFPDWEIE